MIFPFFPQTPEAPRLRLVPGISEERLYVIDESKDGERLITNALVGARHRYGRAPRLWDARRMKVLAVLAVPGEDDDPVQDTAISLDGRTIVTDTQDGFRAWDSRTGRLLLAQKAPVGTQISGVGVAPDATTVAESTTDGRLLQWTVGSPAPPKEVRLDHPLQAVGYSYGGKYVLGFLHEGKDGATEGVVKTWRADTMEPIQTFPAIKAGIRNVNFGPGDGTIVISDLKGGIHVFESATAKPLFETESMTSGLHEKGDPTERAMARFAGSGLSYLAVPQKDGSVALLDGRTGAVRERLPAGKGLLREMRTSVDGKMLAAVDEGDGLRVWNVETRASVPVVAPKGERITALEFSRDSRGLWVGTEKGGLALYDLATGAVARQAQSSTFAMQGVQVFKDGKFSLQVGLDLGTPDKPQAFYQVFQPRDSKSSYGYMPPSTHAPIFSPDGSRAVVLEPYGAKGAIPVDLRKYRIDAKQSTFPGMIGAVWEPRGAWVACFFTGGIVQILDGITLKPLRDGKLGSGGNLRGSDVSPDGKLVATCGVFPGKIDPKNPKKEYALLWDAATMGPKGGLIADVTDPKTGRTAGETFEITDKAPLCRFSADGKRLAIKNENVVRVFDVATRRQTAVVTLYDHYTDPAKVYPEAIVDARFTPNGRQLIVHAVDGALYVGDFDKGTIELLKGNPSTLRSDNWVVTADGRTGLNFSSKGVDVWDLGTKKVVGHLPTAEEASSAAFTPDERRVLTTDPVDGMVIWDFAERTRPKRLGAMFFGREKGSVAIDAEGRYDANDPSHVTSAAYVLSWSGGLEAVDVGQMKSRFYEPGLFAKLMGIDPAPRRAVPDVATLQLYPSIKLTPKEGGKIAVEVADRDDGGTGAVEVYVNGKIVLTRKGSGYFTWDREAFRSYLIPSSRLRPGERNELRVVAGNEANDLKSPPAVEEIPLPDDLKAPPARLIALCVGVGDYIGDKGDLVSPPSDARAIADALGKVSPRLLPGAVEITTLTTASNDPASRPSRKRILQWFDDAARKATAGDIVIVFMAGHGTDKVGDAADYFFLTQDCDPADVGPANMGVATISGADLRSALAKIPASKQVVVLDTCHSGAASKSLIASRSLSGDYGRAYESIREASGTWVLAGSASDQLSYESSSVDHGMLTYALLEAIDRASPEGLRKAESGDLFVDVESWLRYAVGRVESLKSELDLPGVQQPELRSSTAGGSFDIGATSPANRGELGLRPPRPVVIVGGFSNPDDEDPLRLEKAVGASLAESKRVKPWFDVASHPGAFRIAGGYTVINGAVALRLLVQKFDAAGDRKTIATIPLKGTKADLAAKVRAAVEAKLAPPK